ncbi:MAG TPA: thioredoxin domain-containing protein [Usitatibacter sp.]|jgi:hypothetical protein|nr:thioredoxin domain-containing protein [Usitatibacter sp.]
MPNRLAGETSPYLRQHAANPVDWYPWGEEALAAARSSGKPILLSVGYSACHWCHVMAHESFENPRIAQVMNDLFVNVKVDREERPDIDQVYQLAQQMLTQRAGGWPLTMFLTPDQAPFFGGTYFPDSARYGMPGFEEVLKRVRGYYDANRGEVSAFGARIVEAFERIGPLAPTDSAGASEDELLEAAENELAAAFDGVNGGFRGAPKFPHSETIEFSLRRFAATGDRTSLGRATLTLRRMAMGGIYDQVGGGFSRYSVDAEWAIPHFEKMLYDNGWLLRLYADAWCVTREPLFEKVVRETAAWAMREMQSPEGGYYSSLDADSEGEEGRFYVWDADEVRGLLSNDEYEVASRAFGLDRAPNFEGKHWHLVLAAPLGEIAHELVIDEGTAATLLDSARHKLFEARARRVRPGLDDKVLTSWNALMIAGMARAARVFGRDDWLASARSALDFIRAKLWNGGRLLATYKDGRAHLDAYLDDHAFLLAALLEMMQADFRGEDIAWAREIADALLARFEDRAEGGFFFTAHDHESLIHRPKPGPDNATPSGNGVAALALNRLAFLTGDPRYAESARRTVALFMPSMQQRPSSLCTLLMAMAEQEEPPGTLIVRGAASDFGPWRELLDEAYLPATMTLFVPATAAGLPEPLAKPLAQEAQAWVCEGMTCLAPIGNVEELRAALPSLTMPGFSPSTPSLEGANP